MATHNRIVLKSAIGEEAFEKSVKAAVNKASNPNLPDFDLSGFSGILSSRDTQGFKS